MTGWQKSLRVRLAVSALVLAAALLSERAVPGPVAQRVTPPRLVVLVVVDQLRSDYLDIYSKGFTGGLKRILRDGARFTDARYPYLNTVTCAGHSTIGTGTFPYRHGMILNAWYDRKTGTSPSCTEDPAVAGISYNGFDPPRGDSARRLLVPTLAEQIHARRGRSVVLSLKQRSAITLAGQRADAVVWFDARGGWATSTAFAAGPVPFVAGFVADNPLAGDYDKVWERTLPVTAYAHADDAVGEGTAGGWKKTFPHPLGDGDGSIDDTFLARWQRSPFADEYLGRMAAAAVSDVKLGRQDRADFLGISFSSLDMVGHTFGPRSHEVQDMLVRLDLTLARLLDHLDQHVGTDNYVLGLSSDHGVAEVPEQTGRGGRQGSREVNDAVQKVLEPALGRGKHVASVAYTDIYLTEAARVRLRRDKALAAAVLAALRALPGVSDAIEGHKLATRAARTQRDAARRSAALSYHAGRSGDLIIVPREGWLLSPSVTTHGTHHRYDQHVPVILFGASVRGGSYTQAATPADLAPTLAAIAGVRIRPTDGRVLKEALAVTSPREP